MSMLCAVLTAGVLFVVLLILLAVGVSAKVSAGAAVDRFDLNTGDLVRRVGKGQEEESNEYANERNFWGTGQLEFHYPTAACITAAGE